MQFFKALLFSFLLLLTAPALWAQLKVVGGTTVHVNNNTIVTANAASSNLFEIEANATVINDGIIILGDSVTLSEQNGFPIDGNGYEQATRSYAGALTAENIAGLGFEITTSALLGTSTVRRGHLTSNNGGAQSIERWYTFATGNVVAMDANLVFHYDQTEVNTPYEQELMLYHSIDSGITWFNYGGTTNTTANTIAASNIDSALFLTAFPTRWEPSIISTGPYCTGDTIKVGISIDGLFNPGNEFILVLSDETGSFANPTHLDTIALPDTLLCGVLPQSLLTGSNYALQIISSSPSGTTAPFGTFTINQGPAVPTIIQNANLLTSSVMGNAYQWYLNGNPIGGATNQSHTAIQDGVYQVEVFDTGTGCSTISDTLNVTGVGIQALVHTINFNMYPNPATNQVTVVFGLNQVVVQVMNLQGKVIQEQQVNQQNYTQLNVGALAPGMYMVRVMNKNKSGVQRLMVQ